MERMPIQIFAPAAAGATGTAAANTTFEIPKVPRAARLSHPDITAADPLSRLGVPDPFHS